MRHSYVRFKDYTYYDLSKATVTHNTANAMAVINGTSLFAAAILLFVTFYIPKRNKVNAKRIGIDPGLLGFKTLAAKINFLLHGHSLVNEQYLQVCFANIQSLLRQSNVYE